MRSANRSCRLGKGGALLVLAVAAGCPGKGGNAPASSPAGGVSGAGGAGGTAATGVQTGGADVLWGASADLDGDGRADTIALTSTEVKSAAGQRDEDPRINVPVTECAPAAEGTCRVLLTVGGASQELALNAGYFGGLGIQVIDIDGGDKRKELLLSRFGASEEDPWLEFAVVIYDGSRLHYQELWHSGGYNSGKAEVGKGTLTLHYDECPDAFTVVYRLDGTRLVEADRKTKRTHNPDECAACPYVYLLAGGEFRRQGEILRNLNRADLAGEQSLRLGGGRADGTGAAAGGLVTIELREEKDEVTYLDEVHLDAGGETVAPRECVAGGDFCAADGVPHLLRPGDVLRLTFDVGERAGPLRVVASGYYLPIQ